MDILQRTGDVTFSLANEQIGRTIAISSSWNRIRIGMRVGISGSLTFAPLSSGFTPHCFFGMCSGTASMVASLTCSNAVGVSSIEPGPGAYLLDNTTYWTNQGGGTFVAMAKSGSSTAIGGVSNTYANTYFSKPVTHSLWIVDIEKGSPNYTIGLLFAASAPSDASLGTLTASMLMPTMSVGGYSYLTATASASETAGGFDTINVYWGNRSNVLEISELLWVKLY